jgi:hypothetical protein
MQKVRINPYPHLKGDPATDFSNWVGYIVEEGNEQALIQFETIVPLWFREEEFTRLPQGPFVSREYRIDEVETNWRQGDTVLLLPESIAEEGGRLTTGVVAEVSPNLITIKWLGGLTDEPDRLVTIYNSTRGGVHFCHIRRRPSTGNF